MYPDDALQIEVAAPVQVNIGGRNLILSFSYYAAAEFKSRTGIELWEISKWKDRKDVEFSVILFWAALRDHHPEITFDQAYRMTSPRNIVKIGEAVAIALGNCLPAPDPNASGQPAAKQ